MNEEIEKCAEEGRPSVRRNLDAGCNTAEIPTGPRRRVKADELLNIAKRTDQFITDNGWSWCDMRQVYRILETIHG